MVEIVIKILYVTTIGSTMGFFEKFIEVLVRDGCTVDIACNTSEGNVPEFFYELGCKVYPIQTSRSPLNKGNLTAVRQLRELVAQNSYDIVHCHTPVAAICTRFACRKARKQGTKVFYTAHGFHFYKGAPLKNWLIYYPVEKICSYFTDVLITINQEDYALAKKKMRAKRVEYVPGVGIDLEKFSGMPVDKAEKRRELGIPQDATLLLSVGELNENKNHQVIIRAMARLREPTLHYMIAGQGNQKEELLNLASELGLADRLHLLGFRKDVKELCEVSDIFCFPSRREGLGQASIEAMACGLPLVTSNIHGINDYSQNDVTGYKCAPDDVDGFAKIIRLLIDEPVHREKFSENNQRIAQRYNVKNICQTMRCLYGI